MLLNLKLFHSIFIIFGCTEFATSSVQIVWKLLFQSRTCISPLWTLSLCNKEKKKVPNSHLQKNDSHQFQSLQSLRALVQPNNWSKKKKKRPELRYLCGFRLVWQPVHDKTSASSFYKYSFARKHRNSWKIPRDIFGCLLISVHFLWQIVSRFTFQL